MKSYQIVNYFFNPNKSKSTFLFRKLSTNNTQSSVKNMDFIIEKKNETKS